MRTVADWLEHLELRRVGSDYCGSCPVCGGSDRFHLRAGGKYGVVVGCRGCIDGQPAAERRAAFRRIVAAVFGDQRMPRRRRMAAPDWRAEQAARRAAYQRAARQAQAMIGRASIATHPYLAAKGFPTARRLVLDDLLLVPARDERGALMSVQTITPDGDKRYLPGGRMKGARLVLGREREQWICEGLATALSVQAALRLLSRRASVVVGFSAANLPLLAGPHARIVADHDLWTCNCGHRWDAPVTPDAACPKCGRTAGLSPPAGARYAGRASVPWWQPPVPGDANDMHQRDGLPALANALRRFCRRLTSATQGVTL